MSSDIALAHLEAAIKKAHEAAEKLVRCAESISNPTYSVVMRGCKGDLEILSVRHFQGQIIIMVKNPEDRGMTVESPAIGQPQGRLSGSTPKLILKDDITDV